MVKRNRSERKVSTSISLTQQELAKLHDIMVYQGKRSYSATIAELINKTDLKEVQKISELKDKVSELEALVNRL